MSDLMVIVTGPAGAGKTTIALQLARRTNLPLITKDDIKELLGDHLDVPDLDASRRLGAASWELLWLMVRTFCSTDLIVEANFHPGRDEPKLAGLPCRFLQVVCHAPRDVIEHRTRTRERHPVHRDAIERGWAYDAEAEGPLDLPGEVIHVDTSGPVDIDALVLRVESSRTRDIHGSVTTQRET